MNKKCLVKQKRFYNYEMKALVCVPFKAFMCVPFKDKGKHKQEKLMRSVKSQNMKWENCVLSEK